MQVVMYQIGCMFLVALSWLEYMGSVLPWRKKRVGVYIDTNTFAGLIKSDLEFSERQFLFLIQKFEQKISLLHFIRTPFTIYEYLGIRVKRPNQLNFKVKGFHNRIISPLVAAREDTVAFYENSDRLQLEKIALATAEKRKYARNHALWLFDTLIPSELSVKEIQEMVNQLVWDHMHTTDYPPVVAAAIRGTWPVAMDQLLKNKKNRPMTRTISKMYEHFLKQSKLPDRMIFSKSLPLKTLGDFVDTELVHSGLFGYFTDSKQHLKVHCFTGDPPERVEERIWVLAHTYYIITSLFDFKPAKLRNMGYIHCINSKTLDREKTIVVADIVRDAKKDALEATARHKNKKDLME